jgi:hypothetical protein
LSNELSVFPAAANRRQRPSGVSFSKKQAN